MSNRQARGLIERSKGVGPRGMGNVRGMLQRVAKLEARRALPQSPFEVACDAFAAFKDKAQADVEAGRPDRPDMPGSSATAG